MHAKGTSTHAKGANIHAEGANVHMVLHMRQGYKHRVQGVLGETQEQAKETPEDGAIEQSKWWRRQVWLECAATNIFLDDCPRACAHEKLVEGSTVMHPNHSPKGNCKLTTANCRHTQRMWQTVMIEAALPHPPYMPASRVLYRTAQDKRLRTLTNLERAFLLVCDVQIFPPCWSGQNRGQQIWIDLDRAMFVRHGA
eukprot:scaffold70020_cov23-Tisochrysis_lutea.AAC.1